MKANEAPENIYVNYKGFGIFDEPVSIKMQASQIEYVRKDAFVEKACEWIKEHKEAVEIEDNGIIGWIPDYFIEDFKKYMEE